MRVSKHHYALALARRGNDVFFLNPPTRGGFPRREITLRLCDDHERIQIVDHRLNVPYGLRFRARWLFHLAMQRHIQHLLRALPRRVDVVWSFDLANIYPLRAFGGSTLRLFHPVDEPLGRDALQACRGAAVMFSVTTEILERYRAYGIPRHFINHGLSDEFLPLTELGSEPHEGIRVGLSGNFLRADLDREVLLEIIRDNSAIHFECWGNYRGGAGSNLGGSMDGATSRFIEALLRASNVRMHGPVGPADLAAGYRRQDAFLIAYDVPRDQSRGTNYHKVMEFIATGKVIISNNITTYAARPDLVQMVPERTHNRALGALFRDVLSQLDTHNSLELQAIRRRFARDNTYARQLDRIAAVLADQPSRS